MIDAHCHLNFHSFENGFDEVIKRALAHCVGHIQEIAILLAPFMPETSEKILEQFKGPKIQSQKPLFPRLAS